MSLPPAPRPALAIRGLTPPVRYLLRNLPFERETTFCDVGANPINEPPYHALLKAGACRVVGFEPAPEPFAELQKNKGPNEIYFPKAVGDGKAHVLNIYRNSGLTSILKPHLPGLQALGRMGWSQIQQEVQVDTVALDAIPNMPRIDCLKIDIQGGEKLVFEHARRVLADVVAVIVEVRWMQLYEDEPMSGGVDAELRAQGFMLHKFLFNKTAMLANSQMRRLARRANPDQLVDGDAVYLRHPGKLDALSDDQLCHLALLGASVIASHSLVVAALDELVRRGRIDAQSPTRYVDSLPQELLLNEGEINATRAARQARRAARSGAEAPEAAPTAAPEAPSADAAPVAEASKVDAPPVAPAAPAEPAPVASKPKAKTTKTAKAPAAPADRVAKPAAAKPKSASTRSKTAARTAAK